MELNAKNHNTDPQYIRGLVDKIGLSQRELARLIGVNDRSIRHWISGKPIPYPCQFVLEYLAERKKIVFLLDEVIGELSNLINANKLFGSYVIKRETVALKNIKKKIN